MTWQGNEVLAFTLADDGTVRVTLLDGSIEVYGFWKGKWVLEEEVE